MNTTHEFAGELPIQDSMEQLIIELVRAGFIKIEENRALSSQYLTNECP